jgi:signal transduction histidine kinase
VDDARAEFTQSVLDTLAVIAESFIGFRDKFIESHAAYKIWLADELRRVLMHGSMSRTMNDREIDWLTLHYATRHPIGESEPSAEWFRIPHPIDSKGILAKNASHLEVNQKSVPPYLQFTGKALRGQPAVVFLSDQEVSSQESDQNQLFVPQSITCELQRVTLGPEPEDRISEECVQACLEKAESAVTDIGIRLSSWVGEEKVLPATKSLNLLRNICRVTLLALRGKLVELPRLVVLAPVHAGENLIGGIAFIGRPPADSHDPIKMRFLQLVAQSLLSGARLREEAGVNERARLAEELNRARGAFVQRMAHGLQTPLESLLAHVGSAMESFKKIEERVLALRQSAEDLMLTFSRDNVDALLRVRAADVNVKDFVSTLIFINSKKYEKKGLKLTASPNEEEIPPDWKMWVDKTAFWEVMDNLLSNAWRIEGVTRVQVLVERVIGPENQIRFTVRDDGPGIDPVIRPHLFRPGSGKAVQEEQGSMHGYGLYLSQRAVENLGGRMFLADEAGEETIEWPGAHFVVEVREDRPDDQGGVEDES